MPLSKEDILSNEIFQEVVGRGIFEVTENKIKYKLNQNKQYDWNDPEEWVRAITLAKLIIEKNYPTNRIRTEVQVPRRTPNDFADIVVFNDERCQQPYLVVENKSCNQSVAGRIQGIEQLFGNSNSLRAPLGLYDEYDTSILYDISNYPQSERQDNIKGNFDSIPEQYGNIPEFLYIAGSSCDIKPASDSALETRIRRSHSLIWAGGKRDPLLAFDEWSKILFAKVEDERNTPTNDPRKFQIGTNETVAAVVNRVHSLFSKASREDLTIFQPSTRINLPDKKVFEVVKILQDISLVGTDIDTVGKAFENFFGSIFRGQLGQYFTMRQISRFIVSILSIQPQHFVLDPTCGSGGFLLEALLQVWHNIDNDYAGQNSSHIQRLKTDFALHKVFGIEIHDILARICKINLLLHHDGHTNIEGDKSCLDSQFVTPRLQDWHSKFDIVIGNPPFGDDVIEGDEDLLGNNHLDNFSVAKNRQKTPSEHVIIERAIEMLVPGGKLGFVVPDGLLNNQGTISNCPRMRSFLAKNGIIEAIISLPDHAFRKSGAQNKTSILIYKKFTTKELRNFNRIFIESYDSFHAKAQDLGTELPDDDVIDEILIGMTYSHNYFSERKTFLAEADNIGYTTTGYPTINNDLYNGSSGGLINCNQDDTILGEYRKFQDSPSKYVGHTSPDCISLSFKDIWDAHISRRLDPKYHIFKYNENQVLPVGWLKIPIQKLMRRRLHQINPSDYPEEDFLVMTISQTGEIRRREAGKGNNPPAWLGMYFENSSSTWYKAKAGDVVFSSIDLWKGCIAVVPDDFDNSLVTKEFPIYEITDNRLNAKFLSYLLRSRYYQKAFRAITTGHSNRRRTQEADFEDLDIIFPPSHDIQSELVKNMESSRELLHSTTLQYKSQFKSFSDLIDGRINEDFVEFKHDGDDDDA